MRKLIYAINITIDGCCDHTKVTPSEELLKYHQQLLEEVDTLVYGRKTYQLMVPYWPDIAKSHSETQAENEYADIFVSKKLIVFSHTLDQAQKGNTRIVQGNLQYEIEKLKQEPGKNMLLGGVSLPSQLIELGLVDEFHFVVHPIIAGEGKRLMEGINLPETFQLKLTDSKFLKSGAVALHYLK
jgi:dihydrofolate reductase